MYGVDKNVEVCGVNLQGETFYILAIYRSLSRNLHNRSTLDIGVLGYIGILYHKEHPPEVWHIPPRTPVYVISF
jgi:hypothetical protein